MWILSLATLFAVLLGMFPLQNYENQASTLANAFFMALHRNCWGIAIAWIIYASHMGTGGIVKWFLELPIWIPLGRMSLSFYLVQAIYLTVQTGVGRQPRHFSTFAIVSRMEFNE